MCKALSCDCMSSVRPSVTLVDQDQVRSQEFCKGGDSGGSRKKYLEGLAPHHFGGHHG